MDNDTDKAMEAALGSWTQGIGLIEKLFAVTKPGAVFSEPVTAGEHTVITASEVMVGMGFGSGGGAGSEDVEGEGASEASDVAEAQEAEEVVGFGGGGGGGGGSFGRPVAAISIGPEGVRVDPVFDATKVGIAFFTALGAMFLMLGKMGRAARR
jgi:uncharacterized spore protein YtfJ